MLLAAAIDRSQVGDRGEENSRQRGSSSWPRNHRVPESGARIGEMGEWRGERVAWAWGQGLWRG